MTIHQTEIEQLAYSLWESRGRPDGSSDEDWLAAERTVKSRTQASSERPASTPFAAEPATMPSKVEQASKDSFPASDPPASHLPDRPPSNADAKWAASAAAKTKGSKPAGAKR